MGGAENYCHSTITNIRIGQGMNTLLRVPSHDSEHAHISSKKIAPERHSNNTKSHGISTNG